MHHSVLSLFFSQRASWQHTLKSLQWAKIKSSTLCCSSWASGLNMQQSSLTCHTHKSCQVQSMMRRTPHFNNSPWIRFHSWLNLFTCVERLFFSLPRRLCMMWLNPSACMGAGKHFDQLLFDERYRRTSSDTADGVPPSRTALSCCTCWCWWD